MIPDYSKDQLALANISSEISRLLSVRTKPHCDLHILPIFLLGTSDQGVHLISGPFRDEFARCMRHNVKEVVQLLKDILNKTDAQILENMADELNIATILVDILQANPHLAQPVYNILIAVDNKNAAGLLASAVENLSLN